MEIRDLKIGIIRPKKTALSPWRSNQSTVLCTSSTSTNGIFTATRAMRSMPIHLPSAHSRTAPTSEPTVAKTIASTMFICPWLAVKPARGRTSSLGIGGKMLSRKTMIPTPTGPSASITVTVHAENPLRLSAALPPAARASPAARVRPAGSLPLAVRVKTAGEVVEKLIGMVKSLDKGAACRSQCAHSG